MTMSLPRLRSALALVAVAISLIGSPSRLPMAAGAAEDKKVCVTIQGKIVEIDEKDLGIALRQRAKPPQCPDEPPLPVTPAPARQALDNPRARSSVPQPALSVSVSHDPAPVI